MSIQPLFTTGTLKARIPAGTLILNDVVIISPERAYTLPDQASGVLAINYTTGAVTLVDMSGLAAGLASVFTPVTHASRLPLSLSPAATEIDGIVVGPTNLRVLLAAQTNPSENGIYELNKFGTPVNDAVAAFATETLSGLVANTLYYITCTSTATAVGVNGAANLANPGYLRTTSNGTLTLFGNASGGIVSYTDQVELVRVSDADGNGEFVTGKGVVVSAGSSPGLWQLGTVAADSITVPSAHPFTYRAGTALASLGAGFAFLATVNTGEGRVLFYQPLINAPAFRAS